MTLSQDPQWNQIVIFPCFPNKVMFTLTLQQIPEKNQLQDRDDSLAQTAKNCLVSFSHQLFFPSSKISFFDATFSTLQSLREHLWQSLLSHREPIVWFGFTSLLTGLCFERWLSNRRQCFEETVEPLGGGSSLTEAGHKDWALEDRSQPLRLGLYSLFPGLS